MDRIVVLRAIAYRDAYSANGEPFVRLFKDRDEADMAAERMRIMSERCLQNKGFACYLCIKVGSAAVE